MVDLRGVGSCLRTMTRAIARTMRPWHDLGTVATREAISEGFSLNTDSYHHGLHFHQFLRFLDDIHFRFITICFFVVVHVRSNDVATSEAESKASKGKLALAVSK